MTPFHFAGIFLVWVSGTLAVLVLCPTPAEAARPPKEWAKQAVDALEGAQIAATKRAEGADDNVKVTIIVTEDGKKKGYKGWLACFRGRTAHGAHCARKAAAGDAHRRGALKAVAKKLDKLKGEAKKKTTRSQWAELAKRCGRLRNEIAKLYGV